MNKMHSSERSEETNQLLISKFFTTKSTECLHQPDKSLFSSSETSENCLPQGKESKCTLEFSKSSSKRLYSQSFTHFHDDCESELYQPTKRIKKNEHDPKRNSFLPESNVTNHENPSDRFKNRPKIGKNYFMSPTLEKFNESSPETEESTAVEHTRKKELHQKWIRHMSNTDSVRQCEINTDESRTLRNEESERDDAEEISKAKKGIKTRNLTPLEVQFLEIKRKHLDTILIVEVGYKFKFFGEDARIASKELSIVCIPGKLRYDEHPTEAHLMRFASASIPVHRLSVHVKRLVQAGHKIGVVRQVETAALKKAGDNRNTPFARKLVNVYTKGTYIDDVEIFQSSSNISEHRDSTTGYLLCLTESKSKNSSKDEKITIGILAVQPSTGDIVYDTFEDNFLRGEIETRLVHLAPCELLIVGQLSQATEKLIQHLNNNSANTFDDKIRIDRVGKEKTFAAESYSSVSQFYADKLRNYEGRDQEHEHRLLDKVLNLSEEVTVCLSAMITHLSGYGLQHIFNLTKNFESFSTRSHMLLNGNTLMSLEIYLNQTEHKQKGSLFWSLDKTQTRFGQRLLRKWVGRPLLDKVQIESRINAVEELKNKYQTPQANKIQSLLRNIKCDLERSLIRIYYGKCTRPELLIFLQTLQRIANEYTYVKNRMDTGFTSTILNSAIATLPSTNDILTQFLSRISVEPAQNDDKYAFFHPDHENESITDYKMGIAAVEQELDAHRHNASSVLKKSRPLSYVTAAGTEYLFEVLNSDLKYVPASWIKVSGTKKINRFHTPEVINMLRERDQHKESLSAACDDAFTNFLTQISEYYVLLRDVIGSVAILDCLYSLSVVALQPGYSKPRISDTASIDIIQGRHPMVEQLISSTYIANTTHLSTEPGHTRALCITGPNMGGKSSYVRHVALLVIMAHIGSFLPCDDASIGLLDGIYTRMGAYDSLFTRQSTFQVELSETASILKAATKRSLVILDELGRGTSTHDGVAIAASTLEWMVQDKRCLCLFITHYQSLATIAKVFEKDSALRNVHMKFQSNRITDVTTKLSLGEDQNNEEITFLYEIGEGVAYRSYGLNVARLAYLPKKVIDKAALMSHEMEQDVKRKLIRKLANLIKNLFKSEIDSDLEQLMIGLEEL